MKINLTYVTDNQGKQKAIQMPIKEWEKFYDEYQKLMQFKKIKVDLTDAIKKLNYMNPIKRNQKH